MKIGELLMTLVVAIAVTVFVFFRCKSIFREKHGTPPEAPAAVEAAP